MTTANQLIKGIRGKKKHKTKSPLLKGNPQKKGICIRIYDKLNQRNRIVHSVV